MRVIAKITVVINKEPKPTFHPATSIKDTEINTEIKSVASINITDLPDFMALSFAETYLP